jgi:tripartite-type tricarboxylate transporter receptor subunit TctC
MTVLGRVAAAFACAGIALTTFAASAVDYPTRPIRLIVGFPAGSAADLTARALSGRMGQILGQQFVVESKPGAGSNLAAEFVARAPNDGYTLFLAASANISNAVMAPNLPFDIVKDFTPIARATAVPVILAVHSSVPAGNVQELIALARARPGEILYASTGIGAAPHLSGELFAQRAGLKLVHVPYQGSPQAVSDLLAGRVHMMFSPASTVMSHVESGKLKALASAADRRPTIAPTVPTMAEAGIPDFDTSIWFGLMAPAGTPQPVIEKLARALNETLASQDVLTALRKQGFEPLGGTSEEFARLIPLEMNRWRAVVEAAGLRK